MVCSTGGRTPEDRILFEEVVAETTALVNKGVEKVGRRALAFRNLLALGVLFECGHVVRFTFSVIFAIFFEDTVFNLEPRLARIEAGSEPAPYNIRRVP